MIANDPEGVGKHRWVRTACLTLAASYLAGCALFGATSLPSNPEWRGGCAIGVGRDAILHGSASDARVTWAIDNTEAGRIDLLWPVGYTARFSPQLEVLDGQGHVVAREGDQIIGSCLTQPEDGGAIRVDAGEVRPPAWQPGDG